MGRGDTESAGTLLNNWALVQRALGRPLEAERNFRRAVHIGSADAAATAVEHLEPTVGADHAAARATRELAGEAGGSTTMTEGESTPWGRRPSSIREPARRGPGHG